MCVLYMYPVWVPFLERPTVPLSRDLIFVSSLDEFSANLIGRDLSGFQFGVKYPCGYTGTSGVWHDCNPLSVDLVLKEQQHPVSVVEPNTWNFF
jgi:hypothetical protein